MRVLVVAATVHPDKGSEPGLGWGWIRSLAERHEIWAIVGEEEGNREAIDGCVSADVLLRERVRFFYVARPDGPRWEEWIPLLYYRRYRLWHLAAFAIAERLAKEVRFDIAHQLTMTGYREPGYLWGLDLPFVWGPVGGTTNVPLRFSSVLGPRETVYHGVRGLVNELQLRFHPRVRRALMRADAFVAATTGTREAFRRVWGKDAFVIPCAGRPETAPAISPAGQAAELRVVWCGVHVSRKALPLLLHALSRLPPTAAYRADIIGDGPLCLRWQALARRLGVAERCTWHGWVPRSRAMQIMGEGDVFVLTSLHEGVPAVIMEALALGRPVICLDCCGQSDVVDESSGVKIEPRDVEYVVGQIASALERFWNDRALLQRMGAAAAQHVQRFAWTALAEQMDAVYRFAIESHARKGLGGTSVAK